MPHPRTFSVDIDDDLYQIKRKSSFFFGKAPHLIQEGHDGRKGFEGLFSETFENGRLSSMKRGLRKLGFFLVVGALTAFTLHTHHDNSLNPCAESAHCCLCHTTAIGGDAAPVVSEPTQVYQPADAVVPLVVFDTPSLLEDPPRGPPAV